MIQVATITSKLPFAFRSMFRERCEGREVLPELAAEHLEAIKVLAGEKTRKKLDAIIDNLRGENE